MNVGFEVTIMDFLERSSTGWRRIDQLLVYIQLVVPQISFHRAYMNKTKLTEITQMKKTCLTS